MKNRITGTYSKNCKNSEPKKNTSYLYYREYLATLLLDLQVTFDNNVNNSKEILKLFHLMYYFEKVTNNDIKFCTLTLTPYLPDTLRH